MKILTIRGKNLASLADEFVVDLVAPPLGGCGVFALTGPTGAGKSTILDALSLALFATTPRLSRALKVQVPDPSGQAVPADAAAQLLRRGAGSGFAEAEFVGMDRKIYRARLSLRRANGRASGKPQPPIHELFLRDEGKSCGGNKSETAALIVEKLGLDARQFTRAVLLAQNEFAAFLAANADERATLLETLTGTEHFGALSIRSFDRAKVERGKLELLDAELATMPVMDASARLALDERILDLAACQVKAESQVISLEATITFERRRSELARSMAVAEQELRERQQQSEALEPERLELKRLRRVMTEAKELVDAQQQAETELQRLHIDLAESARVVAETAAALERQRGTEQATKLTAESRQTHALEAQPLLRRAAVLEQELAQATLALEGHRESLRLVQDRCLKAQLELSAKTEGVARLERQLAEAEVWLDAHAQYAHLVDGWSSKREGLGRALLRQPQLQTGNAKLSQLELERANGHLHLAALGLEAERQQARMHADAAMAEALHATAMADDVEMLESAERQSERRLQRLDEMARLLGEMASRRAGLELGKRSESDARERLGLLQELQGSLRQKLELTRRNLQEKSVELRGAERMVGQTVEALRSVLRRGEPCFVCGATEHPFGGNATAEVTAQLQETLASLNEATVQLQKEVSRLEREEAETSVEIARAEERRRSSMELILDFSAQADAIVARLVAYEDYLPIAHLGVEDLRAALPPRREQLVELLAGASLARASARVRATEREAAVRRAKDSAVQHAKLEERRLALERSQAELERTLQKQQTEQQLLQVAQARDVEPLGQWHEDWQQDPARCLAGVDAAVDAWQNRTLSRGTIKLELSATTAQLPALVARATELAEAVHTAEQGVVSATDALEGLRKARLSLFEGRRLEDVEQELTAQLQRAIAEYEQARTARVAGEQALAIVRAQLEAYAQAKAVAQTATEMRERALKDWLESVRQSGAELGIEREALAKLLEIGPTRTIEIEALLSAAQTALDYACGGYEQAVSAAATHEVERSEVQKAARDALGERWQSTAPGAWEELLQAIIREREVVRDERAKALANQSRDEELRLMLGEKGRKREEQHAVVERWQLLASLIGSADGKRLRHLAQEVTLELVLDHANQHLRDLARRYRLERLPEGLHVVVIDDELLSERRGVASLSGGETFLVSLALALGLASLSAEKIRVETLFIDEGFGSLDNVTLQIAVAALDRVQAEGRQVGVVSHVGDLAERVGLEVRVEPTGGGKSRVRVLSRQGV